MALAVSTDTRDAVRQPVRGPGRTPCPAGGGRGARRKEGWLELIASVQGACPLSIKHLRLAYGPAAPT